MRQLQEELCSHARSQMTKSHGAAARFRRHSLSNIGGSSLFAFLSQRVNHPCTRRKWLYSTSAMLKAQRQPGALVAPPPDHARQPSAV